MAPQSLETKVSVVSPLLTAGWLGPNCPRIPRLCIPSPNGNAAITDTYTVYPAPTRLLGLEQGLLSALPTEPTPSPAVSCHFMPTAAFPTPASLTPSQSPIYLWPRNLSVA